MSVDDGTTRVYAAARDRLASRPQMLLDLDTVEAPFISEDCDAISGPMCRDFGNCGLLVQVGSRRTGDGDYVNEWRVTDEGKRIIKELLEQRNLLPRNHPPVRNLGDGEYTCTEDTCDAIYSRSEIKAVMDDA